MQKLESQKVNIERLKEDTLKLVDIESITGNTVEIADCYEQMLKKAGCSVERYEFIPDNPTLVARYGNGKGKKLVFNGHMDVIPLKHEQPFMKDGRIYGRGSCDMKGSLATIIEVLRILEESYHKFDGEIIIIANSLHESPGGRGEDLYALSKEKIIKADAAVVMEGASDDCTIAQSGSATYNIIVEREGKASHQLFTKEGTPHPISVAADVVKSLDLKNQELKQEFIEDIGYASYFTGSIKSGEFYNQMPKKGYLEGVRRYGPEQPFANIEKELRLLLDDIERRYQIKIHLEMKKVRDGYRVAPDSEITHVLSDAIRKIRGVNPRFVGKKLVTDASILSNEFGFPTICSGPNQERAHNEIEFIEVDELEKAANIYLEVIDRFLIINGE